jgi:ATP-dependent Clp protease protease subunit
MDDYSGVLQKYRTILLCQPIDSQISDIIIAKMLALNSINHKPISLYISSPGGCVYSGLKIIDIMNIIESPVHIFCTGLVASMAVLIATNATPGHRYSSENCTFMIHQPSKNSRQECVTISDLEIGTLEGKRIKNLTTEIMAKNTNKTIEQVLEDTERDKYMTAQEALEYGIVDKIIRTSSDIE